MSSAAVAKDANPAAATMYCEFYNQTMCSESSEDEMERNCGESEQCEAPGDGKRSHCYVLWKRDANGNMITTMKVNIFITLILISI